MIFKLYSRRELNPHGRNGHRILSTNLCPYFYG
nr:MAG TPA: hypothetical protein [Caudoviricetes sp.]